LRKKDAVDGDDQPGSNKIEDETNPAKAEQAENLENEDADQDESSDDEDPS